MKIHYIGTGAADWTAAAGPRDGMSRRFSCAVLDGRLAIDLAPTTPESFFAPDGPLGQVESVIYTHSHNDHFHVGTLLALAETRKVRVMADSALLALIPDHPTLTPVTASVGEATQLGVYQITPLAANHLVSARPTECPMHYVIEAEGKRIFWGADGAWFFTDTWQGICKRRPYDRMILDGTLGDVVGDPRIFEHNSLPMIEMIRDVAIKRKLLSEAGQIWLTHLSRDAHTSPQELPADLAKRGLYVSYDGMEDEF